jgi:hypothetical protein
MIDLRQAADATIPSASIAEGERRMFPVIAAHTSKKTWICNSI